MTKERIETWRKALLALYCGDLEPERDRNAAEVNALCDAALSASSQEPGAVERVIKETGFGRSSREFLLTPELTPERWMFYFEYAYHRGVTDCARILGAGDGS